MTLSYAAIVKLHDQVSGPARQVVQATRGMAQGIKQAQAMIANGYDKTISRMQTIVSLSTKISAVTGGGLAAAGASALKTGSQFEDLRTTLKVLEGGAAQAREATRWIKDFNLESPFEMKDVTNGYIQLKNQGINPKDGLLQAATDLASAYTDKTLDDAIQMFKDAAMGDGVRLIEFGIRQNKINGKKGKRNNPKSLSMVGGASSTADTADMIEYTYTDVKGVDHKIRAAANSQKEKLEALQKIVNESFTGLAAARSKTLSGITSNLKDAWSELQQQFIRATKDTSSDEDGGLYKVIKDSLESRRQTLLAFAKTGKAAEWGQQAADYLKKFGTYLQLVKAQIRPVIEYVKNLAGGWKQLALYTGAGAGIWALLPLLSALGRAISLPTLILAGGLAAWKTWHHLLPALTNRFPILNTYLQRFNQWLASSQQMIKDQGISAWLTQLRDQAKAPLILRIKLLKQGWEQRDQWLNKLSSKASQLFPNARPELSELRKQLSLLAQNGQKAFAQLIAWASRSNSGFQKLFGQGLKSSLAWLNTQLQDLNQRIANGTLGQWFDELWLKIQPAIQAVREFATGLWKSILAIKAAILWVKDLVGGWENLGKLVVGLALVSMFSGLLAGLAAIAQITAIAGSGILAMGRGFAWLSRVTGLTDFLKGKLSDLWTFIKNSPIGQFGAKVKAFFKKLGAGILWLARNALPMLGRALLVIGRLFMAMPIGLAITAIIGLGYLLWKNWDWVSQKVSAAISELGVKWESAKQAFRESTWGKAVIAVFDAIIHPMDTANRFIEWLKEKWQATKASLGETTWGKSMIAVFDTLMHPLDSAKQMIDWLREKWQATKESLQETTWGKVLLGVLDRLSSPLDSLKSTIEWLKTLWNKLTNAFSDIEWSKTLETVLNKLKGTLDWFIEKWEAVKQYAADGWDTTQGYVETAQTGLSTAASTFVTINKNAISNTWNRFANWWKGDKQGNQSNPTGAQSLPEAANAPEFKGGIKEKLGYAVGFMQSLGWNRQQAIGIVANLKQESELRPNIEGDGGAAYGVAQWHADRQAEFRRVFGKSIRGSSLEDQLRFVHYEMTKGNEQGAGRKLQATKTAQDAAAVVSRYYERPLARDVEMTRRAGIASSIIKTLAANDASQPPSVSPIKPIQSTAGAVKQLTGEVRGQHELTVNLKAAPGVTYNIEDKKSTGQASRFDVGKQAGAL